LLGAVVDDFGSLKEALFLVVLTAAGDDADDFGEVVATAGLLELQPMFVLFN
jgi:hypothetical protein